VAASDLFVREIENVTKQAADRRAQDVNDAEGTFAGGAGVHIPGVHSHCHGAKPPSVGKAPYA
jgi:hypothetical protein